MRFSLFASTKLQHFVLFLAFGVTSVANAADLAPKVASLPSATTHQALPSAVKPSWDSLTPQQKIALTPLAPEWNKMDDIRKKKWLEIANKFASMKPDEQARAQERMQTWMKLTPEQRMQARENFTRTKQINPEKKSAQWQEYQQLSEEQKTQFANEANKKKSVTNLPPESQRNVKPLAPIKTGPKPVPAPVQQGAHAIQVTPATAASAVTLAAPTPTSIAASQSSAK
ncbi:MAG: DUF3106 domain-containing protein [Pseudomonadota bacterium]